MASGNNDEPTPKSGRLDNLKPFKPGVSGNKSGVSKERAACKRLFEEDAEKYRNRLNEFVNQDADKWLSFEAVKIALAYAIGKPNVVVTGDNGEPLKLDVSAGLAEFITKLAGE